MPFDIVDAPQAGLSAAARLEVAKAVQEMQNKLLFEIVRDTEDDFGPVLQFLRSTVASYLAVLEEVSEDLEVE